MCAPRLALFPGDRKAALSLTFDDGFRNEVRDATEILDPLGIKGTFFLIPAGLEDGVENMISWPEARALLASGHELGTHGYTKFKLHEVENSLLEELVNGGWRTIRDRTGVAPVSYAVAGGSDWRDSRVRAKVFENHFFLRGDILVYGNKPERPWSDPETRAWLEAAGASGEWVTACLHSIVGGYTPFDSRDDFRAHCEWLRAQSEWLWVAPMGAVGSYLRVRDSAILDVRGSSPGAMTFSVRVPATHDEGFGRPLTVVVPTVGGGSARALAPDGSALAVRSGGDGFLVEVPCDGKEVRLHWEHLPSSPY